MAKKMCGKCKRLVVGSKCPICQSSKLIETWKGRIWVLEPEKSEIAKKLGIKSEGEYALR